MTAMLQLFLMRQARPFNDLAVDTLMPSISTLDDS